MSSNSLCFLLVINGFIFFIRPGKTSVPSKTTIFVYPGTEFSTERVCYYTKINCLSNCSGDLATLSASHSRTFFNLQHQITKKMFHQINMYL